MKSLTVFAIDFLNYLGKLSGIDTSRDIQTVTARVEGEGFSFFTITLPAFCKGLEKALAEGIASSSLFPGFKSVRNGELPRFLGGFLEVLFDRETGLLLTSCNSVCEEDGSIRLVSRHCQNSLTVNSDLTPCTHPLCASPNGPTQSDILRTLRQFCLLFSKVLLETTESRQKAALQNYMKVEEEVSETVISELEWARFLTESDHSFWATLSLESTQESTMESLFPETDQVPLPKRYLEIPNGFFVSGLTGWRVYFLTRNIAQPTGWTAYTVQYPFLDEPRIKKDL